MLHDLHAYNPPFISQELNDAFELGDINDREMAFDSNAKDPRIDKEKNFPFQKRRLYGQERTIHNRERQGFGYSRHDDPFDDHRSHF